MASRFYVIKQLRATSVEEEFLALDASVKSGKPPEFRVIRYRREHSARRDFAAPLEIEANSSQKLQHKNILQLSAAGVWDGACFLAFEKVDGAALSESPRKPMDPGLVGMLALQLLDALIYAHSGADDLSANRPKAFHCGFTPQSVCVATDGTVKTRGFVSAAIDKLKRPTFLDEIAQRTAYLSPQVLEGKGSTASSDLFSLGALLWELLAGQPLFKKSTEKETVRAVCAMDVPSVSSYAPLVPASLDSFIARLLLRDPAFQFKSAEEAKVTLEKALFALEAKEEKQSLSEWSRAHAPSDPAESGKRKVIAEIVGTRELLKTLSGAGAAEDHKASDSPRAPRSVPKNSAASNAAWEKSSSYVEAPNEPEEQPKSPTVPRWFLNLFFLLIGLAVAISAAWIYFPDENPLHAALGSVVELIAGKVTQREGSQKAIQAAFAYRNPQDMNRRVIIQGLRQDSAEHFIKECGESGERCKCDFFLASDDAAPNASSPLALSRKYNYVHCDLPEGNPSRFVRISGNESNSRQSNVLVIANSLSWRNILGPTLLPDRLRWVYRYDCDRTFFEGEGIDPDGGAITCAPLQKLGVLKANFDFYTFRSKELSTKPGEDVDFKGAVCGLNTFTKIRCHPESERIQFGLYATESFPFVIPVSLYRAPDGPDLLSVAGFAASTDKSGNCPAGMFMVKQWQAEVPSIDQKTKDGTGLNSSFINKTGELNSRKFMSLEPKPFEVIRQKNRTPCDGSGNCELSALEDPSVAISVPYTQQAALCVLNPSLLDQPVKTDEVAAKALGHTAEPVGEATLELRSSVPSFEIFIDGKKALPLAGKVKVPLYKEIHVEAKKAGYQSYRVTLPAIESTSNSVVDVSLVKIPVGTIDLDSFPPSEATFWLGEEKIFTGNTPIKETLPAGKYKVNFKALKSGAEIERTITIQDGKNVVVDQLIPEKKK